MSTRQDYITAVGQLVQGALPLGQTEKIMAINVAMKKHSKHRPLIVVEEVSGDDGFDYAVADLSSWAADFSVVRRVEYPVDDDDPDADILDDADWEIFEKAAGKFLRFLADTPRSTEQFRVTYTALHTCTDSACTVSDFDEESVQALAAAMFCEMLATYYAQSQDSTIEADSVDHTSRARDYGARAAAFRRLYNDHMGIKEGQVPAASVSADQDLDGSWAGDKLTHPRRYR